MPGSTIPDLCSRYRNENAHACHVADLALKLFDRIGVRVGFNPDDRALLHVAAMLHDIGYSRSPSRHALAGGKILAAEPIDGLTNNQRKQVAAAVALHSGNRERAMRDSVVADLPRKTCALRLAALLRIADGLDHGHMRDAEIWSVRAGDRGIAVTVAEGWYRGNVPKAAQKADLWAEVFPRAPIQIRAKPVKITMPFYRAVSEEQSLASAFHSLLFSQYREAADNIRPAVRDFDADAVHDVRKALRRFRLLLRLLRPFLPESLIEPLYDRVKEFRGRVGEVRDFDVWIDILNKRKSKHPELESALDSLIETYRLKRDEAQLATAKRDLRTESTRLLKDIAWFLRIEYSHRPGGSVGTSIVDYAAHRIRRDMKKIKKKAHAVATYEAPEDLHSLRKFFRRKRYTAEFFASLFGKESVRNAKQLKKITSSLGDTHDIDVGLQRLRDDNIQAPDTVIEALGEERKKHVAAFRKRYKAVVAKNAVGRLKKELSRRRKNAPS